ncbi:pregnancy-specific beta-1-glycoprotein 9-like [Sceloporus undulatus]|uniref:pregnancy-specific beta-1-glycoprotein 9-like n=1 Tax=Sceloporus undulatus TaxID=8520 RepID=UPI001C4C920F|nr:pregnancy-specific beta-1-glycoprotein 9-like [Sceloporus undulatus]
MEPWLPMDGGTLTITPAGGMEDVLSCSWYRRAVSDRTLILRHQLPPKPTYYYGKAYTKRETVRQQCSLHIVNLTREDSGIYIVQKQRAANLTSEEGTIFVFISALEQRTKLTGKAIAGIVVSGLLGIVGVAGLVVYQTTREPPLS